MWTAAGRLASFTSRGSGMAVRTQGDHGTGVIAASSGMVVDVIDFQQGAACRRPVGKRGQETPRVLTLALTAQQDRLAVARPAYACGVGTLLVASVCLALLHTASQLAVSLPRRHRSRGGGWGRHPRGGRAGPRPPHGCGRRDSSARTAPA
jgi:hypothetical protein